MVKKIKKKDLENRPQGEIFTNNSSRGIYDRNHMPRQINKESKQL